MEAPVTTSSSKNKPVLTVLFYGTVAFILGLVVADRFLFQETPLSIERSLMLSRRNAFPGVSFRHLNKEASVGILRILRRCNIGKTPSSLRACACIPLETIMVIRDSSVEYVDIVNHRPLLSRTYRSGLFQRKHRTNYGISEDDRKELLQLLGLEANPPISCTKNSPSP